MANEVFAQLGMLYTGFYALNALPGNTASGYIQEKSGYISNIYHLPIRGGGDGGLYTTSRDLVHFWTRLFNHKCIGENLLHELTKIHIELFIKQNYGLGVYISELNNRKCYSTEGCDAGVGFYSAHIPELEIIINILSNMTAGHARIQDFILENNEKILAL